ncbi:MAG: Hsp20 family protein [Alphaproteobacteria bacterium]|nr:Hsp20 family protein [Alphaproteobacteria bacterium]
MRAFDLSPLFRATVGFDNLARVLDPASRLDEGQSAFPPYDIVKAGADAYRVTLAVAGFDAADIDVQVENNTLTVKAKSTHEPDQSVFLHRGIARRGFERRFELADHIRVSSARMENGLLHIDLKREVPEALKPRRIQIASAATIDAPTAKAA